MVSALGRLRSRLSNPSGLTCLDWLLDSRNPSARWLTLTRVLGCSNDDPDVVASRAVIAKTDPSRAILRAQYPQGYWVRPGIGYSPRFRATVWQILFLAQLGMERIPAIDRAVAHLFKANQRKDGAFRASKRSRNTPACLTGNTLWALEQFGYGEAPQVTRAWARLAGEVELDGFTSAHDGKEPCPWCAVKVLWAVNTVPKDRRTPALEALSRAAVRALLAHPPDPAQNGPLWFHLTFPVAHAADLLQWLEALVGAGHGDDARLSFAWRWLERKQRPEGTWPLERTPGKLWADFGQVGEPNKWVTIRALSVIRMAVNG